MKVLGVWGLGLCAGRLADIRCRLPRGEPEGQKQGKGLEFRARAFLIQGFGG